MTPREAVCEALEHREARPVPFALWFHGGIGTRLDQHYGGQAWRDDLHRYTRSFSAVDEGAHHVRLDPAHFRDLFGTVWRDDRLARHVARPAFAKPSFAGVEFPSFDRLRDPARKEQVRRELEEERDRFRVCSVGWSMGLFERTWALRGEEAAFADVVEEPDFHAELVDRLFRLHRDAVEWVLDLPAEAIGFGDDWGDQRGVMVGAERWRQLYKPRYAELYGLAHRAGKRVFHHSCGSVAEILPDLIEIGVDVLDPLQPEAAGMNPYELKARFGDRITFQGGLGSQSTIPFGTPAEVADETRRLLREVGRGGGYIFSSAKAIRDETPLANAVAIVDALRGQ